MRAGRSDPEESAIQRIVPHDRLPLVLGPEVDRRRDVGLDAEAVAALRARHGANAILERSEPAWRALLRETLRDPMLGFLTVTGGLYAFIGQRTEALTLLAATAPLVAMDAYLHRRTQASLEGLRSRLVARATVLRDGAWCSLESREIVPGDRVRVVAGESFPADGVILSGRELQVDESALSGESAPVRKRPFDPPPTTSADFRPGAGTGVGAGSGVGAHDEGAGPDLPLDTSHWGQAGTRLLVGEAELGVVFTGGETLYGEIVRSSRALGSTRTELQRSVDRLVRGLLAGALALCLLLAFVRLRQGFGWSDALVSALTLAVAALPEEFPVLLAVFLGVGVHRLARRKALVRRAASVENVGRITCIGSDKTGTITRGELALTHALAGSDGDEARLGARAARAGRGDSGDPLDEAIHAAARGRGWPLVLHAPDQQVAATFPFTEDRRRETCVVRGPGGEAIAVTKGAPELVLGLCALDEGTRQTWSAQVATWASEGHKVIGCASRRWDAGAWDGREPESGMTFEGLLAFEDPVREGVADAVEQCREAGIQVVMVTGDHAATATAVARQIGLGGAAPRVLSGEALAAKIDSGDPTALTELDLVVRALPAQKLALVRALQAAGRVVAVTGDGVNDVPALQAADVGIAMGERATRSAREAASIVLLDDCFATVVAAIAEGRQLFWNLRLAYRYLLMIHIPLVLTAALIPLAGFPLLYQPIHIVWLELVIHPSALLAFQALPAPGRLAATRRRTGTALFTLREWAVIALVGCLLAAVVGFGFERSLGPGGGIEHARSFALAALCVASACAVAGLSRLRTPASRWVAGLTIGGTALAMQLPALASRLHVTPLHAPDWALAALGGAFAVTPLLVEAAFQERGGRAPSKSPDARSAI